MARTAKLKIYRTSIGFHDAYVAAPSRAAALRAWGSAKDLFARGAAEEVADSPLAAELIAAPGTVVRQSRGTAAEQLAALPPDAPRRKQPAASTPEAASPRRARATPAPPPPPPAPRPDRAALEAAEEAVAAATRAQEKARRLLADRQTALDRDRRALERAQAEEREKLDDTRAAAQRAYDAAVRRWQR